MRVTCLFHQNWRPEELVNAESMSCSRMNSRCRSQSYDDRVDPGINGLQCPLPRCITQDASFDIENYATLYRSFGPTNWFARGKIPVGIRLTRPPHRPRRLQSWACRAPRGRLFDEFRHQGRGCPAASLVDESRRRSDDGRMVPIPDQVDH